MPSSSKLYLSGLPLPSNPEWVRKLLQEAQIPLEESDNQDIVVKKAGYADACYAFVEFADVEAATAALAKLKDFCFQGYTVKAEFSARNRKGSNSSSNANLTKLFLSEVPQTLSIANLSAEFAKFGPFECQEHDDNKTDLDNGPDTSNEATENVRDITVSFTSKEDAEKALDRFNDHQIDGVTLKAKLLEKKNQPRKSNPNSGAAIDFPLRILVQSELVGAIIGRGGQTIRQITQQTRARVDVHRKDNLGTNDKAITIYGQPENCTNACREILKVIKEELVQTGKETEIEVNLRVLAHNNLIGRIIGKKGSTIKKVMEDTNTKITVSSINEISTFNVERIITISGEIDDISNAEAEISSKLRSAYEYDMQIVASQTGMFPGLHPNALISTVGMASGSAVPQHNHPNAIPHAIHSNANGGSNNHHVPSMPFGATNHVGFPTPASRAVASNHQIGNMPHPQNLFGSGMTSSSLVQETVYLFVPNTSVGAIIGTKGSFIRNVIKFSGASVKITQDEQHQQETENGNQDQQSESSGSPTSSATATQRSSHHVPPEHRRVTIFGNPESQWKAQYLIFEKLREEGFARYLAATSFGAAAEMMPEEVRLTAEILVPSNMVGRIIGKSGANVRELQKLTAASVKLPEQNNPGKETTPVHINGNFYSVQSAQRRLRSLIAASSSQSSNSKPRVNEGNGTAETSESSVTS